MLNLAVSGADHASVPLDQINLVPTPQATSTFQPIAHSVLIDIFRDQLKNEGLSVLSEHHTLARYGQRYFGLFQIDMKREGASSGTVVGLRNAHDKSFPAGICAGNAPFVCSNLCFHNEVVLGRKHTTHIMKHLPEIVSRAIGKLGDMWVKHEKRVEGYSNTVLTDEQAGHLILKGYRAGAIGKGMIVDVLDQWEKPLHEEFAPRNLWSLHNAFTEVYKGNLVALPKRSEALHSIFDPSLVLLWIWVPSKSLYKVLYKRGAALYSVAPFSYIVFYIVRYIIYRARCKTLAFAGPGPVDANLLRLV